MPKPSNPQSRNRYSYVINNPLKHIDPVGRDYIIVSGTTQTNDQDWTKFISELPLAEGEQVYFIPDSDPENINITPRMNDLLAELEGKSDIKLIGFSEGAATVGTFLSNLADNHNYIDSSIAHEIEAAILLECPSGKLHSQFVKNYNSFNLDYLPTRLYDEGKGYNIALLDVWNEASPVHWATPYGWEGHQFSYDSRSFWDKYFWPSLIYGYNLQPYKLEEYHNDVLTDDDVMNEIKKIVD